MGIREKMVTRSGPFLEPGEQVRHVYWCQTGWSPWLMFLTAWAALFFKYRVVCVTDRAVVVLRSSRWAAKPQAVIARLPRATRLGPVSGLWAKTTGTGETLYVHKRFHKDINAADAELMQTGQMPAGPGVGHPPAMAPPSQPQPAPAASASASPGPAGTPPGWYPDPQAPGRQRWFDGNAWTGHTHPA